MRKLLSKTDAELSQVDPSLCCAVYARSVGGGAISKALKSIISASFFNIFIIYHVFGFVNIKIKKGTKSELSLLNLLVSHFPIIIQNFTETLVICICYSGFTCCTRGVSDCLK